VTTADVPADRQEGLARALARGHHGTMDWLARTFLRRRTPTAMWPAARTAVLLGVNYGPDDDPLAVLERRERAGLSVYARGDDYHDVIKGRLKHLAQWLAARAGGDAKVFVDTAPVMEKPLAERAGLGWQGKHTNLVSRRFGSWLFLGSILTDVDLAPDPPEADHCGACRRCLDVCPTAAFPAPYQLDARRCISYLTIEHAGPIPHALRRPMGNRIFGCDDCLAVCPWNKFARAGHEARLAARDELRAPRLAELAALDEAGFRGLFRKSPVKRIGRARLLRNVLIAVGNSGEPKLADAARAHLDAPEPVVRGAAIWALSALSPAAELAALARERLPEEGDASVRREWYLAAGRGGDSD
jgi:epoxyqueuosine reductase